MQILGKVEKQRSASTIDFILDNDCNKFTYNKKQHNAVSYYRYSKFPNYMRMPIPSFDEL